MPGTNMGFDQFEFPSIRAGAIAFTGFNNVGAGHAGVYRWSQGTLSIVADRNTAGPNGVNFIGFPQGVGDYPSLSAGATAFRAGDGIEGGIFLRAGGSFQRIATSQMQVPNGSGGNFSNILPPKLEGDRVVFSGWETGNNQRGVYSWESGSLSVIADRSTPMPGGPGLFTDFSGLVVSIDQGAVAFAGRRDNFRGIYLHQNGQLSRLYDNNTLIPGSSEHFETMGQPSLSNGRIAFWGGNSNVAGVYSDLSGQLAAIADTNTPIPGIPGATFTGFGHLALSGENVAFIGIRAGNTGLYSTHTGVLGKIVAQGDLFDGRTVFDVFMGPQALDGDSIAFQVRFTNGHWGIYRGTIPAPGAAAVLVLGVLGCRRRHG